MIDLVTMREIKNQVVLLHLVFDEELCDKKTQELWG